MKKVISVEDLDCAVCAAKMEENIKKIDGVKNAAVSFLAQKIVLEVDEKDVDNVLPQIVKACKKVDSAVKVLI